MTRSEARDFLAIAAEIKLRPRSRTLLLNRVNDALLALKADSVDGVAVIVP